MGIFPKQAEIAPPNQGCRFVPYTISETQPQMVPMDLNIGFQGLALIQGQIYNPDKMEAKDQVSYRTTIFSVAFDN